MIKNIINDTSKTIVGNINKIKITLAAIISEGSILIEDYPGSQKLHLLKQLLKILV